jgi:hypothetical protein
MDPVGHEHEVLSGQSRSRDRPVNGQKGRDEYEDYNHRLATAEQWALLEAVEGCQHQVTFNQLRKLYETFGFEVKFNTDHTRAVATLAGSAIREQFQYPRNSYVRIEYVNRAISVIRDNFMPEGNGYG